VYKRQASEGAAPDSAAIAAALALYGPLDLEILYDPANARRERIAVEILLQLEALGVRCRLQPATATEVADRIAQRRFQAAVVAWKRPAVQDLGELWGRGGSYNVAGLAAPAVDSLIQVARSPLADTLSNVWQKVEAKALALRPCAILDGHVRFDALGARLIGYHPDPLSPYGDLLTIERRDDGRPADLSAAAPPASHRH
ncbi:MAG: hypothetical protein QUU85_03485, partial [Candidatus Eisenbacteria bacterium]|nr:hypothetical protein [Candidatus Eisenbacteria bacterium]